MITNKAASSDNGGLFNSALLDSLSLGNPYELDTRLGVSGMTFKNPFNTSISTGTTYKDNSFLLKQTYDVGQKDSIVKDTVTTYMFYPRLRFQNEIKYKISQFLFNDQNPDSAGYRNYFNYTLPVGKEMTFQDNWKVLNDEFSLISYPQRIIVINFYNLLLVISIILPLFLINPDGIIMIYMHLRCIKIKQGISYGICWLLESYISMAFILVITKPRFICQEF